MNSTNWTGLSKYHNLCEPEGLIELTNRRILVDVINIGTIRIEGIFVTVQLCFITYVHLRFHSVILWSNMLNFFLNSSKVNFVLFSMAFKAIRIYNVLSFIRAPIFDDAISGET